MINKIFQLPGWQLATISLLGLVLLGALCCYLEKPQHQKQLDYFNNPEKYNGVEVLLTFSTVSKKNAKEVFSIHNKKERYCYIIDTSLVKINQCYSFLGNLTADGKIQVKRFQHHPQRIFKRVYSLFSFPLIIFLFIKYVRFDRVLCAFMLKNERS